MKNILLLTTIYPASDLKYETPVIHYFTREWVKLGYKVKVIHHKVVYPTFFYLMAKLFRDKIASLTGAIVYTHKEKEDKYYVMDGVEVHRNPIFKWIPQGKFTKKTLRKQIEKIIKQNDDSGFVPEIIIGHFSNPQLEIVAELKDKYSARTCMIMHDNGNSIKRIYKNRYVKLISKIDIWGFRSLPIRMGFENNFGEQGSSFYCYSGIPENYIAKTSNRNFEGELKNFLYIGELIKRKYPECLVNSINSVYPQKEFKISYIGKGAEEVNIRHLTKSLKLENNVIFEGFIPRDQILNKIDESDCMIMISKGETFGLVYLEAMARGCITIGSRNEGIDGIILHGVNGFLCEAGNEKELAQIIRHINQLTPAERKQISDSAIATAKDMTDIKVAERYLNNLLSN
jgi:glycosyltransferase involved in cell wall biosynthesis